MRSLILSILLLIMLPATIYASGYTVSPTSSICNSSTAKSAYCSSATPQSNPVSSQIGAVVSILSDIAGIIAILTVVISGIRYATSAGDANKANSAKSHLINALIGLLIVVLADTVVSLIIGRLIA